MEIKPGYNQTEVGVIPEDWEERAVGGVCKLINGRGFKPYEWERSGLPIIRIQNLNGSDDFNFFDGNYAKKLEVESGQLLFAWSGNRGTSFGPYIWSGPLGLLNYHTWKVQVNEEEISPSFFFHALKQLTKFIEDNAHGASALVHTQKWEMEGFAFPLPPTKAEQDAIAEALSDADALIESLEQLIAKNREIKQGAMQVLLTGKKRLPGFGGEWQSKCFDDVLLRVNSKAYQLQKTDYQSSGRFPIVDQGQTKIVGFSDREGLCYECPKGGVIVFGDHTCITKFIDFDFVVGADGTQILVGKEGQCTRFHALGLEHNGVASTGYNRHFKFLKEREFLAPMEDEQTAITAILSDMDTEIAALETKLTKTRQLKQGMMQELLTGKIRLIEPEDSHD